ncbi:isopenicillin N synthase family dioxygenase [Roseococcus suduntuyensis]|uniref:2-oxoglutarate-dependent ethylene/succinate-forming enzyme n=1 Tax=Roseococcus suduntuyensis TaxID=455361 RepID=A0A840A811_9PROT|nr:isopenicillin N synthase family oxygenase [Roseococcus suduntuyensis]MBB3898198.1 isopenicillin N synthase-like dioxygenase [Roseococcus suduntuyensis]
MSSNVTEAASGPAAPAFARWATPNELPVIDFAPLAGGNASAIEAVAREVDAACREIGFLTVVNHPVPAAQIKDIFHQAARFFALPEAEKMKSWMGNSRNFRGFLPMDQGADQRNFAGAAVPGFQQHITGEKLKARKPNRNEAFQVAAEPAPDDADVGAGTPLHGPNQWPADLPGFKEAVLGYHTTMVGFAGLMASLFARGLGMPADYFAQFYKKPLIQLRLLHYLPHKEDIDALEGGDSRAHCDAGGFTMLQQDDVGGLEIKSRSGEWLVVPPVENSFVINIGDSMKMWTNHRYASTLHRVVNRYGRERFSVGVFANPDYHTIIRPLPTCVDADNPPKFDEMKSGEALRFLYSRVWPSAPAPN